MGGVFSVSVTTRPRTAADVEGRDYYFIDDRAFDAMREKGELLEWAEVFGKHRYGTPRKPVEDNLRAGKLMILEIDVQGGLQVKRRCPQAFMVFVLPPSDEELMRRLRHRGRDSEEAIERRFAAAKQEIATARQSNAYDEFILNDNLDAALQRVCDLVNARLRRSTSTESVRT